MKTLSCIIVDDEPLARKGLEKYVSQIDFLDLRAVCKNAMQANTILKEQSIDLLFLDIEMPLLSGIEFLKSRSDNPSVIFTTAYSQYALEGYKFDVIDYLLKPISFDRFLLASNKALRLLHKDMREGKKEDPYIFVKTDKQLVKLNTGDILYIEAMQNYVKIQTAHKKYTVLMTLKEMASQLPTSEFFQTHRSFIVQLNKIQKVESDKLFIREFRIPISKRSRGGFLERFRHK